MLSRRGFLIGTGGLLTIAFVSDARAFIRRKEQEVNMVYRKSDGGGGWHEPPYTEEEEMEFYRRTGGAKSLTIYRSQRPASADKPHPKEEKAGG
jgi:hypothetical protein